MAWISLPCVGLVAQQPISTMAKLPRGWICLPFAEPIPNLTLTNLGKEWMMTDCIPWQSVLIPGNCLCCSCYQPIEGGERDSCLSYALRANTPVKPISRKDNCCCHWINMTYLQVTFQMSHFPCCNMAQKHHITYQWCNLMAQSDMPP